MRKMEFKEVMDDDITQRVYVDLFRREYTEDKYVLAFHDDLNLNRIVLESSKEEMRDFALLILKEVL
jgi:hypothetical protein